MRKNRLIALIGTLTMAAAGLAAVSAGVSSKKAESVSAAGTKRLFIDRNDSTISDNTCRVHYWGDGDQTVAKSGTLSKSLFPNDSRDAGVSKDIFYYDVPSGITGWQYVNSDGSTTWNYGSNMSSNGTKLYNNNWNYSESFDVRTVTLHYNDGTNATEYSISSWYNYAAPTSATGWYTNSTCTTAYTTKKLTADIELWEKAAAADTYKVIYHSNYGSPEQTITDTIETTSGTTARPADTFTRQSGKKFGGWATSSTSKTVAYAAGASIPAQAKDSTLNLYAIWNDNNPLDGYYAKVFTSGHTQEVYLSETNGEYFGNITLHANDEFKLVKYVNESITTYYANIEHNDGDDSAYTAGQLSGGGNYDGCDNIKAEKAGTYRICFKPNDSNKIWIGAITYSVTYHVNGGTGTDDTIYPKVGKTFYTADSSKFTAETGKMFKEWNTSSDGNGTSYGANTEVSGSDAYAQNTEIDLYAIWKDKVADGTYLRGGSWGWDEANQKTMSVDSGTQMVIKGIALDANSGVKVYTYGNGDGIEHPHSAASTTMDGTGYTAGIDSDGNAYSSKAGVFNIYVNTTSWQYSFYALRIHYDGNGATSGSMSSTYPDETGAASIAANGFEWTNHNFIGWNTQANGKGDSYSANDVYNFVSEGATDNLNLYAQWEETTVYHTVSFAVGSDSTGYGTVSQSSISVADGTSVTFNDNKVTIGTTTITATPTTDSTGEYTYIFGNWTVDGTEQKEVTTITEDNLTFVANFERTKNEYTITFLDSSERGKSKPITQLYGTTMTITSEMVEQAFDGLPLGRYYVGLKNNPADPEEDPYTQVIFDSNKECYVSYAFYDASHYEYAVDNGDPVEFDNHRDSTGSETYLQVYTATVDVTRNQQFTDFFYNEDDIDVSFDESTNLTPDGKVKMTAENALLQLRLIYNSSTHEYSYQVALGGLPVDNNHYISIDGVLTQLTLRKSPTGDYYECYTEGTDGKGVEIKAGQTVDAYYNGYYNIQHFDGDNTYFDFVNGKAVCKEDGRYNIYLKETTPAAGDYDTLYLGLNAYSVAEKYASEFVTTLNGTEGLCKIAGYDDKGNPLYDVNMTQLQTFWENHSDAFELLSKDAQGYLKDASPDQSEEASALGKFAWSYQYVYTKYGKNFADCGGDFLEKGYTPNSSRLVSISDVSTSTWIIAAVAVVGIAAVGVFFIYKKRKEI